MAVITERASLLSSQARVQVPWVKVTIGTFTFGIFSKTTKDATKDNNDFYTTYSVQYPNYIQSLAIKKINGQVNQYSLSISYPVTLEDDPNFFEKVFSSVSRDRKIVFSYGDAAQPSYTYKDEEAIITQVSSGFNFGSSGTLDAVINYQIEAVSAAALQNTGCYTFTNSGKKKPSDEIKKVFRNNAYGLKNLFSGMDESNLSKLIDGSDKAVELKTKINMSAIDYINYLVSCMVPQSAKTGQTMQDIYILTLHDDTTYDKLYSNATLVNGKEITGPYFKVTRTSRNITQSDAYVIDIGYNTSTIVTSFSIKNNEGYSIYYDYQKELNPKEYVRRLNQAGEWEDVYAPASLAKNDEHHVETDDVTWWTKITKYPISATITIQGLLRPAMLMTYVRLNVIFPGGKKHISSGLYVVTAQTDKINTAGYRTELSLTRIDGDDDMDSRVKNIKDM